MQSSLCGLALAAFDRLLFGGLQYKAEYTAAGCVVLYPDVSAMRLDDRLADRQTKADSLPRHFLPVFNLMKFVEDLFLMILGHAGPRVRDRNQDFSATARSHARHDVGVAGRKFQRI